METIMQGFLFGFFCCAFLCLRFRKSLYFILRQEFNRNSNTTYSRVVSRNDTDVLFFPDKALPCHTVYNKLMGKGRKKCQKNDCRFLHGKPNEPESALIKILYLLNNARNTIDICMYLITLEDLSDFLIHLHEKNVTLRIISDPGGDETNLRVMDQIERLQEAGIKVTRMKTSDQNIDAKMHNKFVIVDNKMVISGSYNWTIRGTLSNDENITVLQHHETVRKFVNQFERLWKNFQGRTIRTQQTIRQQMESGYSARSNYSYRQHSTSGISLDWVKWMFTRL